MASVILKSLKFSRILNGRLPFTYAKLYHHSRHIVRQNELSRNGNACYATAAHKQVSSEEPDSKNDLALSKSKTKNPVDDALSSIDSAVRRNGRTQMKLVNNAYSIITSKEMTTSTHGLYFLRSCKYCYDEPPSKRIELANKIWNKYQELDIQFDVRHYNALLDVHISNGLAFDPVEILNSMEESNIEPNRDTYILVMKKYCEDGNINGASEILEHMKEKGLSANEDVFNNLIQGHLKNNDFSGAKDMIEVMRSSNLQPSADTYGILACAYAASGNNGEMMTYLKMVENDSVQIYLKVIDALARSGNQQHVDDVLSLIKQKEIYQQEFLNIAIELIHKDFIDIAYKLVTASCASLYDQAFHIFIKQLIKAKKPVSEIMKYCSKIHEEGFSDTIFPVALKSSVEYGRFDCIAPVIKRMEALGQYLRPSNFWSLFSTFKDGKSQEGIWLILKQMYELGVPADFTTYYEIIFPVLQDLHPNNVLTNIEQSGQSKEVAADALFLYYCKLGKIDYAHYLSEITHVCVSEKLKVQDFVKLYGNLDSNTADKYIKVLKYMFMDENYTLHFEDIRGELLAELIMQKPRLLDTLLDRYEDVKFSPVTLASCEQILRQNKPYKREYPIIVKRLQEISADRKILFKENLTVEEENKEIRYLQAQDRSCRNFLAKRINYHIKTKNLTRLSELLSKYDELNLPYTPLLLVNLTNLYCLASDVEKAAVAYNKLKTDFPSFKLELSKALDFVTLLVKYQKLDESIEAMKDITPPYKHSNKDNIIRRVSNLSLAIANSNNAEFAKTMQNLLLQLSEEFRSKKAFLHSVLQMHLQKNDFNAAYEEFKNCVKDHRTPVGLSVFLRKCISMNEKDVLQKVIDLTISCVSKSYALLELTLAFIETRNYDKAEAVIESLGKEADHKDVEELCVRLKNLNKLKELEHFISITRSLSHLDREELYILAIKGYANKADFDKVVELYEKLRKEVGEPSLKTLKFIQELFKKNNQPLPYSVISKSLDEANEITTEATKTLIEHLEAGNAETALKELSGLKKGYIRTLSIKQLTDLIDLCLQKDCISDLSSNVHTMSYIIDNAKDALRPLLEKYSAAGDIEKFNALLRFFPDFSLMGSGFNSYFSKAFISSGKHAELLSQLEQRAESKNKMFSFAAFEELIKYPEYKNRIFDLAVKYYNSNFILPMAVLWAVHFSKENFDMADEIFKSFRINIDSTDSTILKTIRQNENVTLAQKYINVVKSANVRDRVKERAYGAAIDVLVLKEMYDEAVALVLESEQLNLQLNKYYLSTLITLKNVLEKDNKPVPFHLPLDASS